MTIFTFNIKNAAIRILVNCKSTARTIVFNKQILFNFSFSRFYINSTTTIFSTFSNRSVNCICSECAMVYNNSIIPVIRINVKSTSVLRFTQSNFISNQSYKIRIIVFIQVINRSASTSQRTTIIEQCIITNETCILNINCTSIISMTNIDELGNKNVN